MDQPRQQQQQPHFIASAPGKVILAGEHAVVSGSRCIAAAIGKRTTIRFQLTHAARNENTTTSASAQSSEADAYDATVVIQFMHTQLAETHTYKVQDLRNIAIAANKAAAAKGQHAAEHKKKRQHGTQEDEEAATTAAVARRAERLCEELGTQFQQQVMPLHCKIFLLIYLGICGKDEANIVPLHAQVTSSLPIGGGLGSSASYACSVAVGAFQVLCCLKRKQSGKDITNTSICATCGENACAANPASSSAAARPVPPPALDTPAADTDSNTQQTAAAAAAHVLVPCARAKTLVQTWSYRAEMLVHGNPSGVDNAVATHGGFVVYRRGEEMTLLDSATMHSPRIVVTNTGVSRNTKEAVADVCAMAERYPSVVVPIFSAIDGIVGNVTKLLTRGDGSGRQLDVFPHSEALAELFQVNQALLVGINVGHVAIDKVIEAGNAHGYASKLTGAGRGGCVLSLARKNRTGNVTALLKEVKERLPSSMSFEADIGCDGVTIQWCV